MQIEIDAPRPVLLLLVAAAIGGGIMWWNGASASPTTLGASVTASSSSIQSSVAAVPVAVPTMPVIPTQMPVAYGYPYAAGYPMPTTPYGYPGYYPSPVAYGQQFPVTQNTFAAASSSDSSELSPDDILLAQAETQVRSQEEQILRAQLDGLEAQSKTQGAMTAQQEEEFQQSTRELTSLLQDKQRAEEYLVDSLKQMWQANKDMELLSQSQPVNPTASTALNWPVKPLLGISAYFHDPSYFDRFKFQHNAIDIPTPQGSYVHSAGEGIVVKVADNGLGFNYITVQHPNGLVTLYGHVTKFLVKEGDRVAAGQSIALSGGQPGTPGAGVDTTGPHLHFSVYQHGAATDPLQFLSPVSGFTGQ